jgi:uncharacterized membrane protein
METRRLTKRVGSSLWFVPVVCVLVGLCCSIITIAIDRANDYDLIPRSFTGGPDAALQILGTIAASMVSLAALVLTITMVVVQLAMGQFSPRVVQRVLRDKPSQLAIGVFVATFAHAMLAMREVMFEPRNTVPGCAIVVAYFLVFVSIVVLVMYVHHIGQSLRVSALIELVGRDTRKLIDRLYPDKGSAPEIDSGSVVPAPRSGVVTRVAYDRGVELARAADCALELVPAIGQFVPAGAPLFIVHGASDTLRDEEVAQTVELDLERTLDQDTGYGLRLLVDIAERSISESPFQDPTTAVQAIDRLHDCLRQLARRPFPDGMHRDDSGVVRLTTKTMDWDAYVHLAFDEVRRAGARSPQVTRRLEAALQDLLSIAPTERRPVLEEQLQMLEPAVIDATFDERDAVFALEPDPQGIGDDARITRRTSPNPRV